VSPRGARPSWRSLFAFAAAAGDVASAPHHASDEACRAPLIFRRRVRQPQQAAAYGYVFQPSAHIFRRIC